MHETAGAKNLTEAGSRCRHASDGDERFRHTLHLDFTADDPVRARENALLLAEGLGVLRDDVQTYSALLSAAHRWAHAEPVLCLATGPEGAARADITGHPGWHAEVGINGPRWGEGEGTTR